MSELRAASWRPSKQSSLSLLDALTCLDAAAEDARVDGVVLRFNGSLGGWSMAHALRRAVWKLRTAGKSVVAWGQTLGAEEYFVATAAHKVWLPESGSLFLVGLRSEQIFLRDLLAKLDVKPEVVRIGNFKTAGEMVTRDSMSREQREQLESWQSDLFDQLAESIAQGRELTLSEVRDRIDGGPYGASAAVESGLVDALLYPDEVEDELYQLAPVPSDAASGPRRVHLLEGRVYASLHAFDPGWRPLLRDFPAIAYVVAAGAIQRGAGLRGITSEGFGELLEGLRTRREVRGVVLRVDSPGGDALASDSLFRSVRLLGREKPVVVSMGDVAASGGYYLAAAADAVLAEVGTLTGSIGVVGGKVNLEGLYRRLGIARDAVEIGARAGLLSEARGFTSDERAAVRREMAAIYDLFLERVAEGRQLSLAAVERVAQGRVWSGLKASTIGLVDAIGGPIEAIREVRARAGIDEGERSLLEFHPRRSLLSALTGLVGATGTTGASGRARGPRL